MVTLTNLRIIIFVCTRWSQISKYLPGRTDNEIKNYWHSYLKKSVTSRKHETTSTPQSHIRSVTNSFEALESTTGRSSFVNVRESLNPQVSSFSPSVLFSEWLDHGLVMDQAPKNCSYVQDLIVPEVRGFVGTFGPRCYDNNSLDEFLPNSDFLLQDEIYTTEFWNSFSDNFLFDGLVSGRPM